MYTQIWNKYLPIIKILLKRSIAAEQTLALNITDFERAGLARKAGNKFDIQFSNGRAENVVTLSQLAKDLSATLLQDKMVKDLFLQHDFRITLNTKYQLGIKCTVKPVSETEGSTQPVNEDVALT